MSKDCQHFPLPEIFAAVYLYDILPKMSIFQTFFMPIFRCQHFQRDLHCIFIKKQTKNTLQ